MTIESPNTISTTRVQDNRGLGAITPSDARVWVDSAKGVFSPSAKTGSYTVALTDRGTCIEMNSSSNFKFFINTDAAVNFDVGACIEFCRIGTGTVTLEATTPGTTNLRSPTGTFTLRAQYSSASVRKRAANEWIVAGDLT